MRNESKWLVVVVVVVVVVMAAVAIHLSQDDTEDTGIRPGDHPVFHRGSIVTESFRLDSDDNDTWITGTIAIYRSGSGFAGDIVLQYYEDPVDPSWIEFVTYHDFYMTEVRTDHVHPDGACLNATTLSWNGGSMSNSLLIEKYHDCAYRDDGTFMIHIESIDGMNPDQTQAEFLVGFDNGNKIHVYVDLPMGQ